MQRVEKMGGGSIMKICLCVKKMYITKFALVWKGTVSMERMSDFCDLGREWCKEQLLKISVAINNAKILIREEREYAKN